MNMPFGGSSDFVGLDEDFDGRLRIELYNLRQVVFSSTGLALLSDIKVRKGQKQSHIQ